MLTDIISVESGLEVIDTAADSGELLLKIKKGQPDLVIMNYKLPENTRFFTFRQIQQEFGVPILMLIDREELSEEFVVEAMRAGVFDFVKTPRKFLYPQYRAIKDEIVQKIWAINHLKIFRQPDQISEMKVPMAQPRSTTMFRPRGKAPAAVVVIGASTGGTQAIEYILKKLKPASNAVYLIAVHLPAKFTKSFARRLRSLTSLKITEGKIGMQLQPGKVIIAPGDCNMMVCPTIGTESDLHIDLSAAATDSFDLPSVDILMQSVAQVTDQPTLGIILSGMGTDGTAGSRAIWQSGGETIAQDEASSVIFGMAKSAIEKGYISKVLSLTQIPDYINRFTEYYQIQPPPVLYKYNA